MDRNSHGVRRPAAPARSVAATRRGLHLRRGFPLFLAVAAIVAYGLVGPGPSRGITAAGTASLAGDPPPAVKPPASGSAKSPAPPPPRDAAPKIYGFEVVKSFPHDPGAYCQGLVYLDGKLYEGTGRHGESSLRRGDLESGEVDHRVDLERRFFGEGIAIWKDRIVQLTWRAGVGFVRDRKTFEVRKTFHYAGEGWGLTHDGKHLIQSDGTAVLRFLDPETLQVVRRVTVADRGHPVPRLNELEVIDGEIYANVFMTDFIVRIEPRSGRVVGWIDLRGLLTPEERRGTRAEVLNGIAYDAAGKRLLVTGKYWPKIFQIRLVERRPAPPVGR